MPDQQNQSQGPDSSATQQSQSSTTQDNGTQQTQATESPLDAVYREFNVDAMADDFRTQQRGGTQQQQTQQAVQQQQTVQHVPAADAIPDPVLDAAGFKAWAARQAGNNPEVLQTLRNLHGVVNGIAAERAREREEADIRAAVDTVKKAGFEADDDFIEIALGQQVRKDQRFLKIYANRHQNPAAWNKALGAFANHAKGKFAFKTDANLADNVRAAKNSTQTSQSTASETKAGPLDERFAQAKTPAEFDRAWAEALRGGSY